MNPEQVVWAIVWLNTAEYGGRVTPTIAGMSLHRKEPTDITLEGLGVDTGMFEEDPVKGPVGQVALSEFGEIPGIEGMLAAFDQCGACFIDFIEADPEPAGRGRYVPRTLRKLLHGKG